MTHGEAKQLVALLMMSYPYAKATPETGEVYIRMLLELDFELTQAAVALLLKSSKFLPSVAEIHGKVTELKLGPKRLANDAYGELNSAVRRFGRYQVPEFKDPLVAKVVAGMGWDNICNSTNEDALRARFLSAYEQAQDSERAAQQEGYTTLLGAPEHKALPAPERDNDQAQQLDSERQRQLRELREFTENLGK